MSIDYDVLRTVHRMLKQLTDIRSRMERGPMKMKIVQTNEASFLKSLETAKESLTQNRMAADAKQLQLAEREASIEDLQGKLNICESNREYQLLKDRIAADLQANSVLQDEILELLERLDVLESETEQAKVSFSKAQSETEKITGQVKQELETLKSEHARVTRELAESEKQFPPDMFPEYKRMVAGKGENALGSTDTETCGNCNRRLTIQFVSQLMMKKALFCQGCGCILYVAAGLLSTEK